MVEPKNRESTDSRHRVALHKTGYISEHFSGVPVAEIRTTVEISALLVFGYSFVCVVRGYKLTDSESLHPERRYVNNASGNP